HWQTTVAHPDILSQDWSITNYPIGHMYVAEDSVGRVNLFVTGYGDGHLWTSQGLTYFGNWQPFQDLHATFRNFEVCIGPNNTDTQVVGVDMASLHLWQRTRHGADDWS